MKEPRCSQRDKKPVEKYSAKAEEAEPKQKKKKKAKKSKKTKNKHRSTSAASESEQAKTRLENADTKPFEPITKTDLPEKAKSELI
ncbi:hypothetical protein FRC11_004065, partial [Ceratobasidium sp. 423]